MDKQTGISDANATGDSTCCCGSTTPVPKRTKGGKPLRPLLSTVLSLIIGLFPKCPLCWAAYMSMFSGIGLAKLPYMKWLLPVLAVVLMLHIYLIMRKVREKGYGPLFLSVIGGSLLVAERLFLDANHVVLTLGILMIAGGSFWNNFSLRVSRKPMLS